MEETPGDRISSLLATNPVAEGALRIRNSVALARLKRIAEDRPTGAPRRTRELAGQRVLITGGSSGIGLAAAEKLGAAGARLALLARDEVGLVEARRRVREQGAEAHVISADIADRDSVEAGVAAAAAALGGLDVVVCAAVSAAFGPFVETDPDDFDATVATVLLGTANTIRAALPQLESSAGALVVVGSIASRLPVPSLAAYTAGKHGLRGLVEALRIELAEAHSPVSLSLLNPGPVDTPLWEHLQSSTGLLPPPPTDLYSAETIAEALLGVIRRPRAELTVGGGAAFQVAFHDNLRRAAEKSLLLLHRLAQSGDERRAEDRGAGPLREGHGEGRIDGGNHGRSSVAVKALTAWDRLRLRIPGAG
jgi:NAD(P)-dependent dehydrogenase (short-subunit alcohol dehydrogenase family)